MFLLNDFYCIAQIRDNKREIFENLMCQNNTFEQSNDRVTLITASEQINHLTNINVSFIFFYSKACAESNPVHII